MRTERATLWLAVGILVGAGLAPLLVVLFQGLTVDGRLSLAFYRELVTSPRQWSLLGNSVLLSALVTLAATAVGLPLGVLFAKTDLPCGRALAVLSSVPFLLPPYVLAIAWSNVLARGGLVEQTFGPAAAETTHAWFFGLPGAVLVLGSGLMPVVVILTMAFTRTVPRQMEEVARLQAPWSVVLTRITVPLVAPGVLLGGILVFVMALGEFAVPMFLRFPVHAVESFTQFAAFYRPDAAAASAVPLALVVLLVLTLERAVLRERTFEVRFTGSVSSRIPLGRLTPFLFGTVVLWCGLTVALPLASLAFRAADTSALSEALAAGWAPILRSVGYALVGATLLTLVGFVLGYAIQRRAIARWRTVDTLTVVLFAFPSTVIGVGLVTLWNRPGLNWVYGTAGLVLVGYLAQLTALTSRASVAGLSAIPPSFEEAARLAGAGWLRTMTSIVAPLAGRALGVAWLAAYLFCMRDTGLSMITYPPGGATLPVRTFTLMANGSQELVAAMCMIMIVATLLPLAGFGWMMGWRRTAGA